MKIHDYTILEKLYSGNSIVYKAAHSVSNKNFILKVLNKEYPESREIEEFRKEYRILKSLSIPGVIKAFEFGHFKKMYYIVLEDTGGSAFSDYLANNTVTTENFLTFSITIAGILRDIHNQKIIHKDINPANIIYNKQNGGFTIIDFGISHIVTRKESEKDPLTGFKGTFNYIAPEQTGRINRPIDYRSDLYSLGITMYQMICGCLPFMYDDPMETIHAHLAKLPRPPDQVDSSIFQPVSKIIMKLLSKDPNQRYNRTEGLLYDLGLCLNQYKEKGAIDDFEIGTRDFQTTFRIPKTMHGREMETRVLSDCYNRAAAGRSEFLLIDGPAGIGKTTLFDHFARGLDNEKSLILRGKAARIKKPVPYRLLIMAVNDMVAQILARGEKTILLWKSRLNDSLGNNGGVITDVIPDLELIIGKQPEAAHLSGSEARVRFKITFINFVKILSQTKSPLVLFLDNLMWADDATLEIVKEMVITENLSYLMIAATYRSNELSPDHHLSRMLSELGKEKSLRVLKLEKLKKEHLHALIWNTLQNPTYNIDELVGVCYEKTDANPFFLKEFLYSLQDSSLIYFDTRFNRWQWDIEKIRGKILTENVIDLLCEEINSLPRETRTILQFASCFGRHFEITGLIPLSGLNDSQIIDTLLPALRQSIIVCDDNKTMETFSFYHERLRQVIYSLLDNHEKEKIHYTIGSIVLKQEQNEYKNQLFDLMHHLILGKSFITDRDRFNALIIQSGKKAIEQGAYGPALDYIKEWLGMDEQNQWKDNYAKTFEYHLLLMEACYLNGNFEEMEENFEKVITKAGSLVDKLRIYRIKILGYKVQNKSREAFDEGKKVIKLLKMSIPENPSAVRILFAFFKTMRLYNKKSTEVILNLPEMKDPLKRETVAIFNDLAECAGFIGSDSFILFLLKIVEISLKNGLCKGASRGFYGLSIVIVAILKNIKKAIAVGGITRQLVEKQQDIESMSPVLLYLGNLVIHYQEPLKNLIGILQKAYTVGIETGQIDYACLSRVSMTYVSFFAGMPLLELQNSCSRTLTIIEGFKQVTNYHYLGFLGQLIENLVMNDRKTPEKLSGSHYDIDRELPGLKKSNNGALLFHLYLVKQILAFLFEHYREGLTDSFEAEKSFKNVTSLLVLFYHHYYQSLNMLSLFREAGKKERRFFLKKVKKNLKVMKFWSSLESGNYLHKYYLVKAELLRVTGKDKKALEYYEKALKQAKEQDLFPEIALINKLLSRFYNKKNTFLAQIYIKEAYFYYDLWGAARICTFLHRQYSSLLTFTSFPALPGLKGSISTTGTSMLDINSLMTASQKISSEIEVKKLLYSLIKIIIENAGANKGVIILNQKDRWLIQAQGIITSDREDIRVLEEVPYEERGFFSEETLLSEPIVSYVIRTAQEVVLQDASNEGLFISDAYVKNNKSKSILCLPVLHKSKLALILYLENDIVTHAFTSQRQLTLELLSTQIYISIENALMYKHLEDLNKNLEQKVIERTSELQQKTEELQDKNNQILTSIDYASKIQSAILPKKEKLTCCFSDYFVLWKPKDIVGGDFYWFTCLENDTVLFLLADCTGHGVPGALMTMTAHSILRRIITDYVNDDPAKILKLLNKMVRITLKQNEKGAESNDGMDISIILYKKKAKQIIFAGAKQDLYYCTKKSFFAIKGNKQSIGYQESSENFCYTNQVISTAGVEAVYLASDGLTQQLGGQKHVSFGKRKFHSFIQQHVKKSCKEQKELLWEEFETYRGSTYPQLDDVTVVGLKL